MAINPRFTKAQIREKLEKERKLLHRRIIVRLNYLGTECVRLARSLDTYKDRTGNLRNSIGFVIVYNGLILQENFEKVTDGDGSGAQTVDGQVAEKTDPLAVARELAETEAENYTKGYALIVVAGMNYAAAVEANNYDVLTSAELYAKDKAPEILKKLKISV